MEEKIDPALIHSVHVVEHDPIWKTRYLTERKALLENTANYFVELEHIGSTAVPHLKAKPIIDIMAAIKHLEDLKHLLAPLNKLDYRLVEAGMINRYFFQKHDQATGQSYHLHVVSLESWPERKERHMRDYLLEHTEEARAYGALKVELAKQYPEDSLAYTKAKTDFIQDLLNKAYDKLGLERIDVRED